MVDLQFFGLVGENGLCLFEKPTDLILCAVAVGSTVGWVPLEFVDLKIKSLENAL